VTCGQRYASWLLLAVGVFFCATPTAAAQGSSTQQANMHVRVLTYDRNSTTRGGKDKVVLALLYNADDTSSSQDAGAMHKAFTAVAKTVTVEGRSLSVIALPWSDTDMAKQLKQYGVSIVFASAGMDSKVAAIAKLAAEGKMPTMANSRAMVRAGLAIGVIPNGDTVSILINRKAAEACGMQLDARVFKHAELVP